MKTKILSTIIAIIAIFTVFTVVYAEKIPDNVEAVSEEYSESASDEVVDGAIEFVESKFGDVNMDGKRTASDARLLLRVAAQLDESSVYIVTYGDYNRDGSITASDARTALRVSAQLENIECILHGHDLDEKVIEPTCTNEGYTTLGCTRCSHTENIKVNIQSKKEHSFKKGSVIKGTCVSDGYTEYKCSVCGTVEKRDITKAGGHKYEYISKEFIQFYEPYHFAGYKTQKKCIYCSKIITAYEEGDTNIQIETQLVSSKEAKNIQEKFGRYNYKTEGYDITGKKVVIYGTMYGIDIDGYFYNLDGTLMSKCERCGKIAGLGEEMCDILLCGITFN